jgi:hypothetical protein
MRYLGLCASAALLACLGCAHRPAGPVARTETPFPAATAAESGSPEATLSGTATETAAEDSAQVAEGDRLFKEGLRFYLRGRPGSPDSNQNLDRAAKRFRAALELYEQAARKYPNCQPIQNRIQDCNIKIYACAKMRTL